MASASRALAVLLATLAACSAEQALPPPAPASLEPSVGYSASEIPVVIRGADFHVRAEVSVEGPGGTRLSEGFRAWVGETELVDVVRLDAQTIAATIPAGVAGGSHALVVEGPYGTRGSAPDAYVALTRPPPVLTVTVALVRSPIRAGEDALFDVTATNVGPGAMRQVQPNVKRVVDGPHRVRLPPQPPVELAEGASFTWRYGEPALEPGRLEYEVKASAIEVATGAGVSADKVVVAVDVEAPPAASANEAP